MLLPAMARTADHREDFEARNRRTDGRGMHAQRRAEMRTRGARRFREQKWLLDSVVSTIGLDWDLLRMATVTAPIGFEGMGDWAIVAGKAKRFDDISPSFEEVAAGREARAHEAEQQGNEVTARECYLVASIYYGVAQWPIDEINERNLTLNARKLDCYARYAMRAHHKIERVEIPMGQHILPAGCIFLWRVSLPTRWSSCCPAWIPSKKSSSGAMATRCSSGDLRRWQSMGRGNPSL
jgi:hypothetical protein